MPVFNSRSERASVQLRRRGRSWADEPSPPGKVERTGLPSLCHRGGTASSNLAPSSRRRVVTGKLSVVL